MNLAFKIMIAVGVYLVLAGAIGLAQPAPKPSPELEAIGAKLMQEINANIQCNANAIAGRIELERLTAEVKRLTQELADAKQVPGTGKTDGSSGSR